MKLFVLAHAAGNVWEYEKIFKNLRRLEIIPVELPGNLSRFGEKLPDKFMDYVGEAYRIISDELKEDEVFSIWGHSFGGYVTYELAKKFTKNCLKQIFISGCVPPHVKMDSIDSNVNYMRYFGYSQIYNEELEKIFNPILRKLVDILWEYRQKYVYSGKIDVKSTILVGQEDLYSERYLEWNRYIEKNCMDIYFFRGGHFYFKQNEENIQKVLELVEKKA